MYFIACLILIIPLLLQITVGSMAMIKVLKWNFDLICIITMFSQIGLIFLTVNRIAIENQNVKCGMPQVAIIILGIIFLITLLITIGIQVLIRKLIARKAKLK